MRFSSPSFPPARFAFHPVRECPGVCAPPCISPQPAPPRLTIGAILFVLWAFGRAVAFTDDGQLSFASHSGVCPPPNGGLGAIIICFIMVLPSPIDPPGLCSPFAQTPPTSTSHVSPVPGQLN